MPFFRDGHLKFHNLSVITDECTLLNLFMKCYTVYTITDYLIQVELQVEWVIQVEDLQSQGVDE